ncbi:hypothetical protein [Nannocystis sp. SCPEA4]|uniref:hypothetical protein n=1 Tax=Nannocystis sp. SCPEA4 TaxID=2996787 RepID=UPI002271BECB|nr:hypothetical protein [Nannocystis sp. SCPEA4]MCY1061748.1 hypothetical protein [Nannocystis sp. SCPEA4]
MPLYPHFTPPSSISDLTPAGAQQWSDFLAKVFTRCKNGSASANDGPRRQFVHPLTDDVAGGMDRADITWNAFPRQVTLRSTGDLQRWQRADRNRDLQDEYCEWSVRRDDDGRILAVQFTCEGPEYWNFLAALQPETVLELYRRHVSPEVDRLDLFPSGQYNPRNRWNAGTRDGAIHLIQPNNTLQAEIELAAGASIVRRNDGAIVQSSAALIRCSRYGASERHSDPHIGSSVNTFAREGRLVTLADPVGLFIAGLDLGGFRTPDAEVPAKLCWTIERGGDRPVRAVFAPPPGAGFTVSDITIDGRPIMFGGQIADKLTIALSALASRSTSHLAVVDGCRRSTFADDSGPDVSGASALYQSHR